MNNKSIQILRGSRSSISNYQGQLEDGQPLYNKTDNYLTLGGGQANQQPITTNKVKGYFSDRETIQETKSENDSYYFGPSADGTTLDISSSKPINIGKLNATKPSDVIVYSVGNVDITLLDLLHPIGSIFETTSVDFNTVDKMQNYFGGTWEVFGAGRVIIGNGTYKDKNNIQRTFITGVSSDTGEYSHQLTSNEMPSHTHTIASNGSHSHTQQGTFWTPNGQGKHYHDLAVDWPNEEQITYPIKVSNEVELGDTTYTIGGEVKSEHNHSITLSGETTTNGNHNHTASSTGGDARHNNIQPYIVVYRYRRTA